MVGTGVYAARRNKKTSDYLVAGRKLGWVTRPGAVKLQHPLMNRAKFVDVKPTEE